MMKSFYVPVKIFSAVGCVSVLADEIKKLGVRNPLVVTDPAIVAAGILERVTGPLKKQNIKYGVFDRVELDPKMSNVKEVAQLVQNEEHDLLIGLGGGSSIDTAKAAALQAVNDEDLREFEGLRESYPNSPLPIIAIPTTAGTGSEVSSATMIIDDEKMFKMFLASAQLRAKVAFLDAEVLGGIPSSIAAATGVDALTHAMEAYLSPNRTFISEAASLEAVRLVFANLRAFVGNTKNLGRGQNMLEASCLAGIGMTAGLGLVHGLAHPLGVKCGIGHGLACALFLPHVLRYNWTVSQEQYMRMALAINWNIRSKCPSERAVALQVVKETENLLADIGIPKRLSDMGKSLDDVGGVVDEAYSSFLNLLNPRPASRKDLEMMVQDIL